MVQVLASISSSVMVREKGVSRDIGLMFRVSSKLYLPGYVRCMSEAATRPVWNDAEDTLFIVGGEDRRISPTSPTSPDDNGEGEAVTEATPEAKGPWEYTQKAVQIIAAYQRAFPEVFVALQTATKPQLYTDRIWPALDPAARNAKLLEVASWLKQVILLMCL